MLVRGHCIIYKHKDNKDKVYKDKVNLKYILRNKDYFVMFIPKSYTYLFV